MTTKKRYEKTCGVNRMNITITINKQELAEAIKSSDSFDQFIDICECRYELELFRAMFEAITEGVNNGEESYNSKKAL